MPPARPIGSPELAHTDMGVPPMIEQDTGNPRHGNNSRPRSMSRNPRAQAGELAGDVTSSLFVIQAGSAEHASYAVACIAT